MKETFYRPTAPGGTNVRAYGPAAPSVIIFRRHDVVAAARLLQYAKDVIRVEVSFEVPQGKVVHLLDEVAVVSAPERETVQGKLARQVRESFTRSRALSPDTPLTDKTTRRVYKEATMYGSTRHAHYIFRTTLPLPETDTLQLKLPGFTVDGAKVGLPAIQFTHDGEFQLVPLNC